MGSPNSPGLEYFILMWSSIGLTLFSNTGILWFTLRSSAQLRKKPSVMFIINGAIVNVTYSILIVVFAVHYELSPTTEVCKVFDYFASFSSNIMVLTVTVVSLDKYCAIMKPFVYRNHGKAKNALFVIALLWCLSVIFTIPKIISLSFNDDNRFCRTTSKDEIRRQPSEIASEVITVALVFVLPSIVICTAYGRLIYKLWLSKKDSQTTDLALLKSRRNITKLAITVTVFFMLCWLPYCITSSWWSWTSSQPQFIVWLDKYSLIIIVIYTGVSPLLFALHNEAIRRELNRKCSCFSQNRVSVEPTSN